MPQIALLNGLKIKMYSGDHNPPHLHAERADFEAAINFDGGIEDGEISGSDLKAVRNWIETNRLYLEKKWNELNPELRRP